MDLNDRIHLIQDIQFCIGSQADDRTRGNIAIRYRRSREFIKENDFKIYSIFVFQFIGHQYMIGKISYKLFEVLMRLEIRKLSDIIKIDFWTLVAKYSLDNKVMDEIASFKEKLKCILKGHDIEDITPHDPNI